jgi:hypothetical protein
MVVIRDEAYILPSVGVALSSRKSISRPELDVIVLVVTRNSRAQISALAHYLAPECMMQCRLQRWSFLHRRVRCAWKSWADF